ncbi:hypothetical protein [Mucilaginibacter antarcticus]|uniref:hypothetical protein n=1 Tax=Mucilaginibacter antarcticus TaxID=1855725 RepID=UPI00363B109F
MTWRKQVLPVMGLYLGIKYQVPDSILYLQSDNLAYLPQASVIDSVAWQHIINYYVSKAPEHLPVPKDPRP